MPPLRKQRELMAACRCRAFVPTVHLSDLGSKASRSKFKVGQEVRGRVLERNAAAKRILMTLKKALIGSKLPAIAHLEVCVPYFRAARI